MAQTNFAFRESQQVFRPGSSTTDSPQAAAQSTPFSAGRELSTFADDSALNTEAGRVKTRKARITLDDNDYVVIMRASVARKADFTSDSRKASFWEAVRQELLRETQKDLALPKQVVERLMRDRHFYLENHPEERGKSDDEITALTDEWIEHVESLFGPDGDPKWKMPPTQERRIKIPGTADVTAARHTPAPGVDTPMMPPLRAAAPAPLPSVSRPPKRSRDSNVTEQYEPRRIMSRPVDIPPGSSDPVLDNMDSMFANVESRIPEPAAKRPRPDQHQEAPQRVVVEGGLSKQDWLDVAAAVKTSDPRIPALEAKIDSLIETTKRTHQMLMQLLSNRARRPVNGTDLANGEGGGDV